MKRFALFVTLLGAISPNLLDRYGLAQSKQKPIRAAKQSRTEVRVPGIIELETAADGKLSGLVAPAVVQAGKDFKITIYTFGGGCERKGDEEVTISQRSATVKVYDFRTIPRQTPTITEACTLALKTMAHTVTLRFAKPGEATIKIVGQQGGIGTSWSDGPFVREHRLRVTK